MIILDASLLGWGAYVDSNVVPVTWTPREIRMHINLLELQAVCEACKAFLPFIQSHHLIIVSENITIIFYINNQGGARSIPLGIEAVTLWNWYIKVRATQFTSEQHLHSVGKPHLGPVRF